MKKLLLTILFAGLMAPAGLMAQKVYKRADNRVIIDLTNGTGMPQEAVTDISKTDIYAGYMPVTHYDYLEDNLYNGSISAKVFRKFEVAPHDLTGDGTIGPAGGIFTWMDAFNYCKNLEHNGKKWRLPTHREFALMWIFRPALESLFTDPVINGSPFRDYFYWDATESGSAAGQISFSIGQMNVGRSKASLNMARCIREIEN